MHTWAQDIVEALKASRSGWRAPDCPVALPSEGPPDLPVAGAWALDAGEHGGGSGDAIAERVAGVLAAAAVSPRRIRRAVLVADELGTNARRWGRCAHLAVHTDGRTVRIDCRDTSRTPVDERAGAMRRALLRALGEGQVQLREDGAGVGLAMVLREVTGLWIRLGAQDTTVSALLGDGRQRPGPSLLVITTDG